MKTKVCGLALLLACVLPSAAQADEVTVAVAANFAGPMARLAEGFQASTGHTLKLTSGATGRFYSQIVAGAPFDVLLAADDETPRRLVTEGHAVAGTQFTYAVGQLVLWSAQPGLVDDQGAVLKSTRFTRLAIANPKLAPYGRAAQETLAARGLSDAMASRIVTAESIAQAYQFVVSGNAEIGFVALSQVTVPGKPVQGSHWRVPSSLHGEIRQDAVLLTRAQRSAAAQALLVYLRGAEAKALIQRYGYGT
jgi:molybdate transport system substrate-binding protein